MPVPLAPPGSAGELVLLTPLGRPVASDEHWLLALWRDAGALRTAALFQCSDAWSADEEHGLGRELGP